MEAFREADVENNYYYSNMYIKARLSYKGERASRETERGRRRAKWGGEGSAGRIENLEKHNGNIREHRALLLTVR